MLEQPIRQGRSAAIYTREQRMRRDASRWTMVQAILAPLQFLVFLASTGLVAHYLLTGGGLALATASVVLKTFCLYAIMITGAIWEKEVFGQHLFAPAFFWEDAVSMIVIALHTAYIVMLLGRMGSPETQLWVALAGYLVYVINAGQFLWKLRLARLEPVSGMEAAS